MRKNPLHNSESKAGILITVIFHLTVIIVLLLYQIDATVRREESFVIDFSRQEEIERQEREMEELEKDVFPSRKNDTAIETTPITNNQTGNCFIP